MNATVTLAGLTVAVRLWDRSHAGQDAIRRVAVVLGLACVGGTCTTPRTFGSTTDPRYELTYTATGPSGALLAADCAAYTPRRAGYETRLDHTGATVSHRCGWQGPLALWLTGPAKALELGGGLVAPLRACLGCGSHVAAESFELVTTAPATAGAGGNGL